MGKAKRNKKSKKPAFRWLAWAALLGAAFIVVSKFLKPDVKFCRLFPISLIFTAIFYIFFSVLFRIAFYDPLMDAVIAFFRS